MQQRIQQGQALAKRSAAPALPAVRAHARQAQRPSPACQCQPPLAPFLPATAPPRQIRSRQAQRVVCSATSTPGPRPTVPDATVSVILLAGGVGKRMGASIPKQYLDLKGQPIATYSLQMFAKMREVCEIIIVCDPSWRDVFQKVIPSLPKNVAFKWALPGAERQDSVFNGLQQVRVCMHGCVGCTVQCLFLLLWKGPAAGLCWFDALCRRRCAAAACCQWGPSSSLRTCQQQHSGWKVDHSRPTAHPDEEAGPGRQAGSLLLLR